MTSFTALLTRSAFAPTHTAVWSCCSPDDCIDLSAQRCSDRLWAAKLCLEGGFTQFEQFCDHDWQYMPDVGCVCDSCPQVAWQNLTDESHVCRFVLFVKGVDCSIWLRIAWRSSHSTVFFLSTSSTGCGVSSRLHPMLIAMLQRNAP